MARVIIIKSLKEKILKTFKQDSIKILSLMKSLETNPKKGKTLATISNILIKELKFKKYRFYFITDGQILKFSNKEDLNNLILKFLRMSSKKQQQKTIEEIKNLIKTFEE